MGKVSGSSVVGTLQGLSRVEDLALGERVLFGVKRENGSYKKGFYPFTLCECINQEYEFHLKEPFIQLNTTPDTRIITDLDTFSCATIESSRGIKVPLIGFYGVPSTWSWELDLSLVSDCEDAGIIDIRDSQFNMLMMLVLKYGYATKEGGVSLPVDIKPDFQKLFKDYNFTYLDDFVGPKYTYFRTNRTAITDFIQYLCEENRELPDEIVLKVDDFYYPYIANALIAIDTYIDTKKLRPKILFNFFKSINYIFLRSNKTLIYYKGDEIVEPITIKKYNSYTKEGKDIKMMYEIVPKTPDTYLVSEGVLLV